MAFYSQLDDGSFEVVQDDGSKLRTALDPSQFGLEMKPANVAQFDSMAQTAGPGGGLPEGVLMSEDEALAHQRGASRQPAPSLESVMQRSGISPDRGALTQSGDTAPPPPKPKAAPIPIRPPAAQAQGPSQNDQLKALVASQIVQRSAPRAGQGFVPTAKTVTTAPAPSQADLDAVAEEELGTEATMLEQAQQSFDARNQLLDQQIAQNAAREAKLAEQYAQRQQTDARLARLQAYAEEKERDVAEMKTLSPTDEYFKDAGGPWARVLAGAMVFLDGLGVAMSAAGGVNRQNEALQAIQRGIKERAEMLKQQYEQAQEAGRTARNAYSDALQMYGTPEMAMQALNDRGEAIADQKIVVLADKQGNQDTLNKALMWQAQRREARAMRVAERNAAAAGQQTTSYANDRGSGGGMSINYKAIDALSKLEGTGDEETQAYAKALQTEGIPQAEARLGGVRDILSKIPKSEEIPTIESRNVASRATRAVTDFVGGAGTATRMLDNQTERQVRGQFDRVKAELRHALAGASLTDTERTDFEGRFDTVNTAEGLQSLTDELAQAIERRKAAIGAGYRPNAVQRYNARKQVLSPVAPPPGARADE